MVILVQRLFGRRRALRLLMALCLTAGLCAAVTFPASAAVESPLSLTFDQQIYGDALLGGNSVLVCPAGSTACTQASNRQGTLANGPNDQYFMTQNGANSAKGWFNSSSISLTIPSGASVAYARLLWAGDTGVYKTSGGGPTVRCTSANSAAAVAPPGAAATTPVQLTVGANAAVSVPAARYTTDTIANVGSDQPQFYSAATNVTPSFTNAPTGSPLTITTANVWAPAGYGCFGGWSLVLVYSYPQPDPVNAPVKREVFVYDGHVRQNSSDPDTSTSITGFRVSGQARVGVVAYEGDWGFTGDQFAINGTAQVDPGGSGSSTNFFTSYAQYASPSILNNFSVDAKQFDVATSVIKPGDTSAKLTLSTDGDTYLAEELVLSVPIPTLNITKTANPTTAHAGDTVTYTITVTNPVSGSTATNVVVNDPITPSCNKTIGSLTGTTSYTCTGTAGSASYANTANVTGTDAQNDALSGSGVAAVAVINPAISITKTADQVAYRSGATVTYTITVNNTGNTNLSSVAVTDPTTAGCAKSIAALAAGATTSYTCTATAPVTGNANTANVSGTDSLSRTVTATSTVPVPVIAPALTLVKSASPTTVTAAGQSVAYSFKVTNSGDSTVNSISIADTFTAPASPVPTISCPSTTLAAGANTTCTGTYTVTQADVDAGSIKNSAVANGKDIIGGAVVSNASPATVTVTRAPALTIRKTATPTTVTTAGQSIAYSFLVTNSGNVTVHALTVADPFTAPAGPAPTVSCTVTTLLPNDSTTCTATYAAKQADIDNGSINNTATASGRDPTNGTVTSNQSAASVTATPGAALTLVKTASPTNVTGAAQTITYSFKVTNTGNLTVNGLSIADTFTAPAGPVPTITCLATTLAPNANTTCTGTYRTTQADVDNGTIKNAAIANATDARGGAVASSQSNAVVSVTSAPKLTLAKTANPTTITQAGQTVTYTFAVTNSGNVTINNLSIADTFTAPAGPVPTITCPATTLAPAATKNCTGTYTATQADVDNGTIKNSAVANGTDPGGNAVSSPTAAATVTTPPTPTLALTKSAVPTTVTALGQPVRYSFLVTNNGNVTLSSVGIMDTLTPPAAPALVISCPSGPLAPGASLTCTAPYRTLQADIDNGVINNAATARATTPAGATVNSNQSLAAVAVNVTSALTLQKAASPTTFSSAGQNITYTFTVINSGQTTITGVAVADPKFTGANAPTCSATSLAPGASTVCTASYSTTQADLDRGAIQNTATATGTNPQGVGVTSPPASATVTAAVSPRLTLTKSANPASYAAAGATITYSFSVVNAGNVTVTGLTISDTLAPPATPQLTGITCAATTLAPAASTTCTATYLTKAADVDNGSISNAATATGTAAGGAGPVTSNQSTATVNAITNAALSLSKSAAPTTITRAGQTITYTFAVTNSGNQTVTAIAITDTNRAPAGALDGAITCAATTLGAGASTTCTDTYTATQADVDFGSVADTAVASGNDPAGSQVASNSSTAIVTVIQSAALSVAKSATPTTITAVGAQITYRFVVTNQGNVTVSGISIADSFNSPAGPPVTPTCPTSDLAPGASLTCTATYTATLADVDHGSIQNSATASGTDPGGNPVTSQPDTATVTVTQTAAMSLTKSAIPTSVTTVGQSVAYRFLVRNTGNVTLSPIGVDDTFVAPAAPPLAVTCPRTTLPPNGTTTCTGSYVVTQDDLDKGTIQNTAVAQFADPSGSPVSSNPSSATVTVTKQPALTVVKAATPTSISASGQAVTYSFLVTNTGNLTVNAIKINDTLAAPATPQLATITCPVTTLAPNANTTCSATYTSTQADVDSGSINNSATAGGTAAGGGAVTSPPSTATVGVTATASLALSKTESPTNYSAVGQTLTYTFTVTNDGTLTVGSLAIADPMFTGAAAPVCALRTLAPGARTTCTARHTVTQADLDAGSVQNTATATGADPSANPVTSPPSAATADAEQTPALTLLKSADPATVTATGATIDYTFHVTNSGNVTVSDLSISDSFAPPAGPVPTITCPVVELAPLASTDCTASYTATQADIDDGSISNTAIANGSDPLGNPVASAPSPATVGVTVAASLRLLKTAAPATVSAAGDVINYTFLVTNTGNVTMSLLSIADTLTAPAAPPLSVACPQPTIAPGDSVTCTAGYPVTQADIDNGSIGNTATANAQTPTGTTINSPPSRTSVGVTLAPALTLTKTPSRSSVTGAGQDITYTFAVTNSGNVTVSSIAITDTMFTAGNAPVCQALSLAPGASTTCTATHTTTQADIDSGSVNNSATAGGTDPQGNAVVSQPATAVVPVTKSATLRLVKSALSPTLTTVGESVTYSFAVTNTGNVTITALTIADTFVDPAGPGETPVCPVTTLAPGATTTCLATYPSTQADFDTGTVTNTAIANGTDPQGAAVASNPSTAIVTADVNLQLILQKTATPSEISAIGEQVIYRFTVTNASNVTIHNLAVQDVFETPAGPELTPTCLADSLPSGVSTVCAASYTATQADLDNGVIANTATVTGLDPDDVTVTSNPSSAAVVANRAASLSLTKTANPTSIDGAGQPIQYTFVVVNTGNVTATALAIDDGQLTRAGDIPVCTPTTIEPGETATCTATYIATQADIDRGSIVNIANATALDPAGGPVSSPQQSATVTVIPRASLSLLKTAATSGPVTGPGATIDYTFTVTNTGNVTVSALSITDAFTSPGSPALAVTCQTTVLAPGDDTDCLASYTTTQADVDYGSVANKATAGATTPDGTAVTSSESQAAVPIAQNSVLTLVKAVTPTTASAAGDQIHYTFDVTNNGNTTITGLAIADTFTAPAGPPLTAGCPVTILAPADTTTCTADYVLTQDDVDHASVDNSATATGIGPDGATVTSNESIASVTVPLASALTLVKTAAPLSVTAAGDNVSYTFAVTNTGNDTLHDLTVADTFDSPGGPPLAISCPVTTLAPNVSTTCTATYPVTQADIDHGEIHNVAHAVALDPVGTQVLSPDDDATVTAVGTAGLSLVKSADPTTVSAVGDQVTYSFVVTNTGTVTINGISIADVPAPPSGPTPVITCPDLTLIPDQSTTCTVDYAVTQADLDNATIVDTATASGTDPSGDPVVSNDSTATVVVTQSPAITLLKTASRPTVTAAGQAVGYDFLVTNSGNVTVSELTVIDTFTPPAGPAVLITCPVRILSPATTTTCTASYPVTQADMDRGSIDNSAVATALGPTGQDVTSNTSAAHVVAVESAALTLAKSALPLTVTAAGQPVAYSFRVTNTGNVTLSGISISDTFTAPAGPVPTITCPTAPLAPNAAATCTATYTVTQDDMDHGKIENSATASGIDPAGTAVDSAASTALVAVTPSSSLSLVKSAPETQVSKAGETVTYEFLVTNTGNVTINDIAVIDTFDPPAGPPLTPVCPNATLAPGVAVTCTADYVTTQADIDNGHISNTATANGTDVNGGAVVSNPSQDYIPVFVGPPAISLVKSAALVDSNGNGTTDVGDSIVWTFLVTNTGLLSLTPIVITDTRARSISCPQATLEPGDSMTCTAAPQMLTQADFDAGSVSNTATVTGTAPGGTPAISLPSTATVPLPDKPALGLAKTATVVDVNHDGRTDPGDTVLWTFTVTNTGNVTILGLVVHDALAGTVTCAVTTVAPGKSVTCTAARHTINAEDAAAGSIVNVATVSGTSKASGDPVASAPAKATVPVGKPPVITPAPTVPVVHHTTNAPGTAFTGAAGVPVLVFGGLGALLLGLLLATMGVRRRRGEH